LKIAADFPHEYKEKQLQRRPIITQKPRFKLVMSQNYVQLLLSPEWRTVKELILDRDCHSCQNCQSKENLHVHHKLYFGEFPWDTPHEYLITLCDTCHKAAHKGKHIDSFRAPNWIPIHPAKQVTRGMIKRRIIRDLLIKKLRIKK